MLFFISLFAAANSWEKRECKFHADCQLKAIQDQQAATVATLGLERQKTLENVIETSCCFLHVLLFNSFGALVKLEESQL
jgi:hypothetical protein